MEFGKILRELRQEKNLTQVELAAKLNVSSTSIRDWEIYGIEPSIKTICQLAGIFEVTVGQLLGTEEL